MEDKKIEKEIRKTRQYCLSTIVLLLAAVVHLIIELIIDYQRVNYNITGVILGLFGISYSLILERRKPILFEGVIGIVSLFFLTFLLLVIAHGGIGFWKLVSIIVSFGFGIYIMDIASPFIRGCYVASLGLSLLVYSIFPGAIYQDLELILPEGIGYLGFLIVVGYSIVVLYAIPKKVLRLNK